MDLSGSTNGLLDDVRDMEWDLINQANSYKPQPLLRIGVVAFSRLSFGKESGYVKILCPLTTDYEQFAFELAKMKLAVEKGDQLVGAALKTAVNGMNWSDNQDAVKVIFLIGNGHVNLDQYKYREAYGLAEEKKIIVNTVYCMNSNYKEEILGWREIANGTHGMQYELTVHKRNPLILTCKDSARLYDLADKLSATYIYFGQTGKDNFKMQDLIDKTAMRSNEMTFQSRLFYKISDLYQLQQSQWDLVDYVKLTNSNLQKIDPSLIPSVYKNYTADALRTLVANKKTERQKIINSIRLLLPYDRQQTINKAFKENEYDKNPGTLDRMIISWLNAKAAEKGIQTFVN
jgi:hypothetical protein